MIILSLYLRSDRSRLLDVRDLASGPILVGRGEGADWILEDPDCLLSRVHCRLESGGGRITVTDLSTNGVFIDEETRRCERGKPVTLSPGQSVALGKYRLALAEDGRRDGAQRPEQGAIPESATAVAWGKRSTEQGPLLEAFCRAARLDSSAIAAEDPVEVMARLGAVYRELITGLAELMRERSRAKDHLPEHTAVSWTGNNPFRWASAVRLTTDLLRSDREGFMPGAEAVAASYLDVRQHADCVAAGLQAMTQSAVAALAPETIEARLQGRRSTILPGARAALAWREYSVVHQELHSRADALEPGFANSDFRRGYLAKLSQRPAEDPA
jgi:predicted component of type VI protein secretion system